MTQVSVHVRRVIRQEVADKLDWSSVINVVFEIHMALKFVVVQFTTLFYCIPSRL